MPQRRDGDLDYQAGKVVATVPIGTGVDGAGYDAASATRLPRMPMARSP